MTDFTPKLAEARWEPKLEEAMAKKWAEEKVYAFKLSAKPVWGIDTPPPYASGSWHIGGAMHYSEIDMIARYKRMTGFDVLFPMGVDRNGLPIEVQTEKEFKVKMYQTDRQHFLSLCKQLLDKYEGQILALCHKLGFSMNDIDGPYRTDSDEYRAITQATFIDLWKKGLIYEDNRPNNWCPDCGTTIADAEIEYQDQATQLTTLAFSIKNSSDKIPIATTRPEFLASCAAILVHPTDERYKRLHGKTAVVPIFDQEVPIISHPEAKMDFGSGAVMICSYGDSTDVRLFRELKLKPVQVVLPDGTLSEAAGAYKQLRVKKARQEILKDLEEQGLILKQEQINHRTPVCWRSKTPVEFIGMPEFYLKQKEFVEDLLRIAKEISFFPPESRQILLDWVASLNQDWPISRRRYYGTEIPLWYCVKCKKPFAPEAGPYYRPWKESPPGKCECGSLDFTGEKRTFDTWMDSSISELVITGWGKDEKLFSKAYPCSIRPQGKDIVRTWLFYTLLRGFQLTNQSAFAHVWISGHVVDEKGAKMSKSVGNVVYPEPLVAQYGADALRLQVASEASLGSDIRYSEERLKGAAKFIQKFYNLAKFISMFPQLATAQPTATDKWILSELNKLVTEATAGYESLDFFVPATKIRSFTWDLFASHYVEMVKGRAYNRDGAFSKAEQEAAWWTLHQVLKTLLKLLAPISPFITYEIGEKVYGEDVHLSKFPEAGKQDEAHHQTELIVSTNSQIWKYKKDNNLSMREPLVHVELDRGLEPVAADLTSMHGIQGISFGSKLAIA